MNPKSTAILFLAAAALAAFIYFYEIQGEQGRRQAEEAEKQLFAGIAAEDVAAIALTASDGTAVRAERRGGDWEIVEPLVFPGDVYAFDAMASALAQITSETTIEDPQPAAVYGLDADEREVRFSTAGAEHALRIGDKTPVGAGSYVAVAAAVYTVPSYRVNAFAKAFDDLREKRVLDFDREAVNRIEARWPDGRVVLERAEAGWQVVEPVAEAADERTVADLLSDLAFLRATGFVDDPPGDEAAGLDRPAFAVRLSGPASEAEGEPFTAELAISGRPDADGRLARGAQASLYRIAEERIEDLPTEVVAYRFKQLAEFDAADAQRVEVLFHSAAGQSVAVSAERGEDGWTSAAEAFQPGKVAALVGALANLRASGIAADSMGPDELAAVSLAPANVVFKVFAAAPEGEEAGEAPELAEIHLGVLRGSEGIIARRAGDDTVFVLDYELAERVPVSYEAFANRFRAEAEPVAETPAEASDDAPAPE